MIPVSGVTEWDLRLIVHDLSPQNRAEAKVLGLSGETMIEFLSTLAYRGYSELAVLDDHPVAAFGVNVDATGVFNDTWFIGTKDFFAQGLAGLRFSREWAKHFREHCGKPLRSFSYSPRSDAPKWFKLMGFVEEKSSRVDGPRVFVYR